MRYIFESRILLLLAYDACLIWSGGGDSGEGGDDGREATDLEFVRQAAAQVQAPVLIGCLLLLLTLDDWEFIGEPALTHREDIQPKRIEI